MEKVKFHFDPASPWCYQALRWMRRLEALGEIDLDWGVVSLTLINLAPGLDPYEYDKFRAGHSQPALAGPVHRVAMLIRDRYGSKEIGRFWNAFGRRWWEIPHGPSPTPEEAVRGALEDEGFDPAMYDEAMSDQGTWDAVVEEHQKLVATKEAFGSPTIVLDGGDGPAIFGPTIRVLPDDETAVELWRHVCWLTRYPEFFELKRGKPQDARGAMSVASKVDLPAAGWRRGEALEKMVAEGRTLPPVKFPPT